MNMKREIHAVDTELPYLDSIRAYPFMSTIYKYVEKHKLLDSIYRYNILSYLVYFDASEPEDITFVNESYYHYHIHYPNGKLIIKQSRIERLFNVFVRIMDVNKKLDYNNLKTVCEFFDINLLQTFFLEECFVIAVRSFPRRPRVWEYGPIVARFLEIGHANGFTLVELGMETAAYLHSPLIIDAAFDDDPNDFDLDERYRNILRFADMLK